MQQMGRYLLAVLFLVAHTAFQVLGHRSKFKPGILTDFVASDFRCFILPWLITSLSLFFLLRRIIRAKVRVGGCWMPHPTLPAIASVVLAAMSGLVGLVIGVNIYGE